MMKRAIVIGASSGIGRDLARKLGTKDNKVGVLARREDLLNELAQENSEVFYTLVFDATEENTLSRLETFINKLGGLDLLVYSAGTGELNPKLNDTVIQSTNQLNIMAFTKIVGWTFRFFQRQGHGHLVAISSIAGLRGGKVAPSYNASKAYQINFLEGLRQKAKNGKKNIFITDVRPGFVDTAMAKGEGQFWVASPEKAAEQILQAIRRKKNVVYITKRWRIIALILKILPNWLYKRM